MIGAVESAKERLLTLIHRSGGGTCEGCGRFYPTGKQYIAHLPGDAREIQ